MGDSVIVLLHGLGGDRDSMLSVGRRICRRVPGAVHQAVEGDFYGYPVDAPARGWFFPPQDSDRRLDQFYRTPPRHLDVSLRRLHGAIDLIIAAGTPTRNIYLVGHSQGGAMALACGLTSPHTFGGICSIAGYLVVPGELPAKLQPNRYFLQHANQDPVVNVRWADYAARYLDRHNQECELRCWDIDHNAHAIDPRQVDAVSQWILENQPVAAADA